MTSSRYAEAHTDCKLYTISGAELVNECARDIVDIMRSAGAFKREFYQVMLCLPSNHHKGRVPPWLRMQICCGDVTFVLREEPGGIFFAFSLCRLVSLERMVSRLLRSLRL